MRKIFLIIGIVALTASGCAFGPKQILQHSPKVNQIDHEYFTMVVAPHRVEEEIVGFDLTIRNKSDNDIEIVWDKTLYIDDGRTFGRFWHKGVHYSEKSSWLPPDIVFQKSTFEKTIWPFALIVSRGAKIHHTPMDAGEHGLYLTVRINGKEMSEKATFHLSAAK